MKAIRFILLALMPCLCSAAFSQKLNLRFEHLTTRDGLSHSNVLCILQDSRGFMWFGTAEGLNRYDGYKCIVYTNESKNPNSLGNNHITGIVEDAHGDLWISTLGGGLSKYDRKTDRFKRFIHEADKKNSLSSNFVRCLFIDKKGDLWLGTEEGLNKFNPSDNTFSRFDYRMATTIVPSNAVIVSILEDAQYIAV